MKPKIYFPFSQSARASYWSASSLAQLADLAQLIPAADETQPWADVPGDVEAIVIGWGVSGKMPKAVWSGNQSLRAISILGGSTQIIEEPIAALEKGIIITNAAREIAEGVAEETLALILASQYDLVNQACHYRSTAQRLFTHQSPPPHPNRSLTGKTVGLIGFGHVAQQVADLLVPFKTRLLVYDPYVEESLLQRYSAKSVPLDELLQTSDVVSLHAGWNKETQGMLDGAKLDLIRPGALLVCTARLPLFDQKALAQRVQQGQRFASDFVPYEESIWSDPELAQSPSLIAVTGHTSITDRTLANMNQRLVEDLQSIFAHRSPQNRVTAHWIQHTT